MKTVKVIFTNGDEIITDINGSDEEIRAYYRIGNTFNLGDYKDDMQQVVSVEIL